MKPTILNTNDPIQKDLDRLLVIVHGLILRREYGDHEVVTQLMDEAEAMINKYTAKTVNFVEAMEQVGKGYRVRRMGWDSNANGVIHSHSLQLSFNGRCRDYQPSLEDIRATDWVVCP